MKKTTTKELHSIKTLFIYTNVATKMPSSVDESDFYSPCYSTSGEVTPTNQQQSQHPQHQATTTRFYSADYLKKKSNSSIVSVAATGSRNSRRSNINISDNKSKKKASSEINHSTLSLDDTNHGIFSLSSQNSLLIPADKTASGTSKSLLRNRRSSNVSSNGTATHHVINTRKYIREVYGPFLCSLLLISALLVILGGALMLAGFYVQPVKVNLRRTELERKIGRPVNGNNIEEAVKALAIEKARTHNRTLNGLRISGVSMLAVGIIGLTILVLIPVVCLRRTEYALLPTEHEDFKNYPRSSFSSASGLPDEMFTFSVVKQRIQPAKKQSKKKSSGCGGASSTASISKRSPRNSRNSSRQRQQQEKRYLSPELNRGPIFVSGENPNTRTKQDPPRTSIKSSASRENIDGILNKNSTAVTGIYTVDQFSGKPSVEPNSGRYRSSSFEIRLSSPNHSPPSSSSFRNGNLGNKHSRNPSWHHSRYSLTGGKLTPDILLTRSSPVKAGSFHSLR